MAEIKIDLEAQCNCGAELYITQNTWSGQIRVEPCNNCLNDKYDEGFLAGQDTADINL